MTVHDQFEYDAQRFADFLVANWPPAREWEDPVQFCRWYIAYGFTAVAIGDDNEIVAMWAARPVERPGMGVLPFYFNKDGKCLHVDLLLDSSHDKRAMTALEGLCKIRFPQCTTIAMFRHSEEALKVYDVQKFWRNFHKLKKIERKREHHGKI